MFFCVLCGSSSSRESPPTARCRPATTDRRLPIGNWRPARRILPLTPGHAGARRFPRERSGDYIWGRSIDSFKDALPGDVLQFRDAVFQGGRVLGGNRKSSWRQDYPHHTAILAEVRERDGEIMVLHQNVGKSGSDEAAKRVVKKDAIRPGSLQEGGWVRIYRPVAPDDEPPSSEPRQR